MGYAHSVLELIGRTPLVALNHLPVKNNGLILAKLEYFNPGGSIKDRTARGMIEAAEDAGLLDRETLIVEPTSGNTGIGLAMICAVKKYTLLLTMPDSVSLERRKILAGFGAEIILTPGDKGMNGAIEAAVRIAEDRKPAFIPMQFRNPANPMAHYGTTGPEIWDATGGKVDIFIAGVGTGGTVTGAGKFLKEKNPAIQVCAVEPASSPVLSGGKPGKHGIQGIGAGFIPEILDTGVLDEILQVSDAKALEMSRFLMTHEGIMAGISSGAAVAAAVMLAERKENSGKTIVVILPDTGERYLSTSLFQD